MDTRFWGPPGWRFLHTLAATYESSPARDEIILRFFNLLPFTLPCKFCRASLTEYITQLPLDSNDLQDANHFSFWLYHIHNKVNDKLREQGLIQGADPTFAEAMESVHQHMQADDDAGVLVPGWDFLFSIAYNRPEPGSSSSEFSLTSHDDEQQMRQLNISHTVPVADRIEMLNEFWSLIPMVLTEEAGDKWLTKAEDIDLDMALNNEDPEMLMRWLYLIYCAVEDHDDSESDFQTLYRRIASYSSSCGKTTSNNSNNNNNNNTNAAAKTCRRDRNAPPDSMQAGGASSHTLRRRQRKKVEGGVQKWNRFL